MSEVEARCRVMVVDDDPDTVEVLSTLLEMLGHDACGARTGRDAIALASSFDPHVVLLDIALPDMTGYDVARAIRDATGRRRFLVAATGFAQERDRKLALESGFDQHLAKPVTADNVRRLMRTASRYL